MHHDVRARHILTLASKVQLLPIDTIARADTPADLERARVRNTSLDDRVEHSPSCPT